MTGEKDAEARKGERQQDNKEGEMIIGRKKTERS